MTDYPISCVWEEEDADAPRFSVRLMTPLWGELPMGRFLDFEAANEASKHIGWLVKMLWKENNPDKLLEFIYLVSLRFHKPPTFTEVMNGYHDWSPRALREARQTPEQKLVKQRIDEFFSRCEQGEVA